MKTNGLGTSQIYTEYCIYSLVVLHAKKPMNKLTIILIGLIFVSFTNNESKDCISDLYSMLDKTLIDKYEKVVTKNEFGIRHSIDSMNYQIIRRWKDDMTPIIESITNELTNIDHWKEYHTNGQLKSVGFMTTSVHSYIGEWKYYSDSGKLDSIVDYDKKYKVPFCEFYQIAKDKGLTGKTSQINFDTEQRKWRIEKWNYGKESASATGIELQVDSMKIEVIELMGIY